MTSETPDATAGVASGDAPLVLRIERGWCYMLFAYDVGLSVDLDRAERVIGAEKTRERISHRRRVPPYFQYEPAPIRVTYECDSVSIAGHASERRVDAVVYDFGAISVTYRFQLGQSLDDLLALSDALYDNRMLLVASRQVVEQLIGMIRPAIARPRIADFVEDYAIYQIASCAPQTGLDALMATYGAQLAQILRCERVELSQQEIDDALSCRISFGAEDLALLDWHGALIFDKDADDARMVLEYANVELLELRYLDQQLDDALEQSYGALARRTWHSPLFHRPHTSLRRIAEFQMDNALLFEGVNNALKLIGDQYLARVYRAAAQRLHLNDWDASILRKLNTLESMYEKVSSVTAHWRAEVLEWIIIILIAISIGLELLTIWTGGH